MRHRWFLSLLPAILCLPGLRVWGQAVSPSAASTVGLETFVVARPASSPLPPGVGGSVAPVSSLVSRPSSPGIVPSNSGAALPGSTNVYGDAILTLFPGISGLETGVSGQWQGRALEARLHPSDWFQHGPENDPGYVQMGGYGDSLRTDQSYGLSEPRGLQLLTPLRGRDGTMGVGLYRTDGARSLVPGINGLWTTGCAHFNAQAGLDGSWRLQSRTQGKRLETDSFAERAGDTGAVLYGMALSARLSGSSTLFQRAVLRPDGRSLSLWALGGVQRMGKGLLTMDSQIVPLAGDTLRQTTLAFHMPLRRQDLLLDWQQSASSAQQDRQIQMMTLMPVNRSLTGWLGEGLAWEPHRGPHSVLTLGASLTPIGRWGVRAEWSQSRQGAPFLSTTQVRGSLGYQYSPNTQLKLLCGPGPLGSGTGTFRPAWGLQVTRRFVYRTTPPTGSVQGRVLLDGLPCAQPFGILLDGQEEGSTDKTGKFILRHVTPGPHTVSLALAALPADMNPMEAACPVDVGMKRCASVLLHVGHVGQVTGHLDVGPDEFGATDPTAGVGVTFTDEAGHATTTDANGNFVLSNLTPGRHTIYLVSATLPPHFCVLSAVQEAAEVVCGRPTSVLHFVAASEHRPVQFSDVQIVEAKTPAAPTPGVQTPVAKLPVVQKPAVQIVDAKTPAMPIADVRKQVMSMLRHPATQPPSPTVHLVASGGDPTLPSPIAELEAKAPSLEDALHRDTDSKAAIASDQGWFYHSGTTFERFAARCSQWLQSNKGGQAALAAHLQSSGVPENVIGQVIPYIGRKGGG